ncbi:MAG: ABC transporter permease [Microterricola sp.]
MSAALTRSGVVAGALGGRGRAGRTARRWPAASVAVSLTLLALAVLAVLLSPVVSEQALAQDIMLARLPIGTPEHLLGTDELGRDVLLLSVAGSASSLVGPFCIALGSAVLGLLLGSLAGYHRGVTDAVIGRWSDLLLALPVVLVAIVVAGVFGGGYWWTVALLIVLFSASDIRIVRAAVTEQAALPYVESAQVLGLSSRRIMFGHILPNVLPLAVTNMLLNAAMAIVALSSLSFLGLGVAAGSADWGRQLADGRAIMADNPAALFAPALLIIAVACAINVVGDWLLPRLTIGGRR